MICFVLAAGEAEPDAADLLAQRVVFEYQASKPAIDMTAPPPEHMLKNLTKCGFTL